MKCELCKQDIELVKINHWLATIRQHTSGAWTQFVLCDFCKSRLMEWVQEEGSKAEASRIK